MQSDDFEKVRRYGGFQGWLAGNKEIFLDFNKITGGYIETFLLALFTKWVVDAKDEWVLVKDKDLEKYTGLTKDDVDEALINLIASGLLKIKVTDTPSETFYNVDTERLVEKIIE